MKNYVKVHIMIVSQGLIPFHFYICSYELMQAHFKKDQNCMVSKVLQDRPLFTILISHESLIFWVAMGPLYVFPTFPSNEIPWQFLY